VLAVWGHGANGGKVLLHLLPGSKEDAETVTAFFQAAQPGPKGGGRGVWAIRYSSSRTARQGSSRRLRAAFHVRPASAAWPTG